MIFTAKSLLRSALLRLPDEIPALRPIVKEVVRRVGNHVCFSRSTVMGLQRIYFHHLGRHGLTLKLRDGFFIRLLPDDVIQRKLLFYGQCCELVWEPMTANLLKRLAGFGGDFLIAGGHVGYFPLLVASCPIFKGIVFTFEPNPRQRAQLAEGVSANALENIVVDGRALFDSTGETLEFLSCDDNVCSSLVASRVDGRSTRVETVRIDDYLAGRGIQRLNCILLDIEGAEPEALGGAERNLAASDAPDLIFEMVPGRRPRDVQSGLLEELARAGYSLYVIIDKYDYILLERPPKNSVELFPLLEPNIDNLISIQARFGLADPNLFATKRGISRFGPVVEVAA